MCELESIFRALAHRKRRHVVACLQEHHAVSLADLAEFVTEKEHVADGDSISAERTRDVYFSLYHKHIPKLEEAGLVRYDQESDSVARTETTPESLRRVRENVNSLLQEP